MNSGWEIRESRAKDAEGLQKCMQAAYSIYQRRMGGDRLPPMDVDYLFEINNYPSWVVDADGVILGGLIMLFDDGKASLANIAIDSQYQGIGGELMRFAEAKTIELNFSELYLATHILLEENISLYLHLGWKEISRDKSRIFMKKIL